MGLIQEGKRQLCSMTFAALRTASLILACKKQQTSDADIESSGGSGTVVSGFVSREHGYLDTAAGRKHMVFMAARLGMKRLFVDVWSRGCTLFKSSVMKSHGGPEICAESEGDPLGELMRYGKQYNIEIVPWFEWGNIVPAKSALWNKNKNRGWSGFEESFHTVPSIRINPYKGDFSKFFADLLKEVVSRYGAKEIHLCDNFAPHTKYGAATAIRGSQAFTAAALKITAPARNAGVTFSLSSQRRLNSLQTFSIDWSRWLRSGVVKWVYPQLYHVSESKTEQFLSEARAEKSAGAIGVALYTGPTTERWTLEGVGRYVKLARSLGLESAIFDFNTLLADQKASNNAHIQKISQALGTRMRYSLTDDGQPPQQMKPPPPPVLPAPVLPAPVLPTPDEQPPAAPVLPPPEAAQPVITASPAISPTPKTHLCEYMKVVGAPESGAPAYLAVGKGEAVDSAFNEQLAYRHLTQNSLDGSEMMYVTLYSADGTARVRWLESKYLAERRPEEQTCTP
ncbi:MAG: hypothetical protein RL189_2534 [Pseudomonadota bacterium]